MIGMYKRFHDGDYTGDVSITDMLNSFEALVERFIRGRANTQFRLGKEERAKNTIET